MYTLKECILSEDQNCDKNQSFKSKNVINANSVKLKIKINLGLTSTV